MSLPTPAQQTEERTMSNPELHTETTVGTSGADTHERGPEITEDAPVVARAELEIDATVDTVWGVLTAIGEWPAWNPDVKSVSFDGPVATGSTFRWKAGPGTINSTIEHIERPRLIAWSGNTLGIRATHVWRLEQRGGKTFAQTEESYEGLVVRILRRPLQKALNRALSDGLGNLKIEAERTARSAATRSDRPSGERSS